MFEDPRATRRELLGGAAVALSTGLAGCSGALGSGARDASTPEGTDSPTGSGDGESSGDAAQFRALTGTKHGIDLAWTPALGSSDAAVDVYYWSDYQCPFCARFESGAYPSLVDNEVAAGTARLVVLQYPNIGAASTDAGLLAKAVWKQVRADAPGRFGTWHSHVFENQGEPNSGWASLENLLELTREVEGVDASATESYLEENRADLREVLRSEKQAGMDEGVSGTPGFVLYDRSGSDRTRLMGAQPYSRFESEIEKIAGGP